MYEVFVERKFTSTHFLRNYRGQDEPAHDHTWRVRVWFRGNNLIEPEGYLVDFIEAKEALKRIVGRIDRKNINDVEPFNKKNPSAENIALWLYGQMCEFLPSTKPSQVTVWETDTQAASYIP